MNNTKNVTKMDSTTDYILEMENTSVTYHMDRGTSRVLNEVSLDIQRYQTMGIVGESGSGKSMLASAFLDAVPEPGKLEGEIYYYPENGERMDILSLNEEDLRKIRWSEISMVFQGAMSAFNPTLTIRGHFEETAEAHNADSESVMRQGYQLMEDLHMDPERVMGSYPHELSGGMAQRALIALSLFLEPEVLIMDEPTASLDLLMQRSIIRLLKEIQTKYEFTLIFITHDLPLVTKLTDYMSVMYAFEIVESAATDQILSRPAHPYTKALLNATPTLTGPLEDMRPIEGTSPDPVNIPTGCSYHPRCPFADDQCRTEDPGMIPVDESAHRSACHYAETVADESRQPTANTSMEDSDE